MFIKLFSLLESHTLVSYKIFAVKFSCFLTYVFSTLHVPAVDYVCRSKTRVSLKFEVSFPRELGSMDYACLRIFYGIPRKRMTREKGTR